MGGFRLNGCGATDHFSKVKSLGIHRCPRCKRNAEIFLKMAKFKIDVFFIPTVTLKSRYAVMCSACDNGQFCSDEWANHLMSTDTSAPDAVIFESDAANKPTPPSTPPSTPTIPGPAPNPGAISLPVAPMPAVSAPAASGQLFCLNCGAKVKGKFCSHCGAPVHTPTPAPPAQRLCPGCGAKIDNKFSFCMECGRKLN